MDKFSLWLKIISTFMWSVLFPILSFIFYLRKRCLSRLLFLAGLLTTGLGSLLQLHSPVKVTFDELGNAIPSNKMPSTWYIGNNFANLGIILAVVGFALVLFENGKSGVEK